LVALSAVLLAAGCSSGVEDLVAGPAADKADDEVRNAPQSPPPLPPPPPPAALSEPEVTEADVASDEGKPLVEPAIVPSRAAVLQSPVAKPQAATTTAKPPAAPSGRASIRLSAGVALAQTLPTGTAMGFSVDYQFTEGQPNPSSLYVWVIEPAKGPPARIKVRLSSKGTLQGFALGWRPEHGPFEGHLEDARGNWLSGSLPLR
jgi:hypothetical protein